MKRLPPFSIHQPKTVSEASGLISDLGDSACFYAGGTELLLAMKEGALQYEHLIDIKTIPSLDNITIDGDGLTIGAAVTHLALERSSEVRAFLPVLANVEARIANPRVRATGTLVGNLCFAEPHSDPATLLICLGAMVRVDSLSGHRWSLVEEFISGPFETNLGEGELLSQILVPTLPATWKVAYRKFQIRERPTLGISVAFQVDEMGAEIVTARIAVGCASPSPRRSSTAEDLFVGPLHNLERRLQAVSAELADDAELIDSIDGKVDYQRHLIEILLRRAVSDALS